MSWTPRDGSLDEALVERLLDGAGHDAVPAGYLPLVGLVAAARTPATEGELAGEDAAVAMFRARRPVAPGSRGRSRRAKGFLVVSAVIVSTATGAAAATGNLPDPAQELAAELLELIGIHIPSAAPDLDVPSDPGSSSAEPSSPATVPSAMPTGAPAWTATTDDVADRVPIGLVETGGPAPTWPGDPEALLDEGLQARVADVPLAPEGDLTPVEPGLAEVATGQSQDEPPSSPEGPPTTPVGPPPGGPPESTPVGPPAGVAGGGPPLSTPVGPPAGVAGGGPPLSTPVGPPAGVAGGGPPPSLPGAAPAEPPGPPEAPPAGPPMSVPGDPPPGVPSGPPLGVPGPPPSPGP